MSGPFKLKYKNSDFPFKKGDVKGLSYKPPKQKTLSVKKHVGLMPSQTGTSKSLSEILPKGIRGGGELTYNPTKNVTLKGGVSGSLSEHGLATNVEASLQKKFKGGKFNVGISKSKGSKPFYGGGISLNI